jgi:hypothetical protein
MSPQRAGKLYFALDALHIPIWLFKDLAWVLLWRPLGVAMVVPALAVAVYLCVATRRMREKFLLNCAILCWISANSFWMLGEFFEFPYQKVAVTLFATGIVIMGLFFRFWMKRSKKQV